MTWEVWIDLFVSKYCVSKGIRTLSIATYKEVLDKFKVYSKLHLKTLSPDRITLQHLCDYIDYLRNTKGNGNATVNKTIVVIKSFYNFAVSYELISPNQSPTRHLPKMKAAQEVAGDTLSLKEINTLTNAPDPRTVIGIRDRAMLLLLCMTGIRASECEGIKIKDIDLERSQIRIRGKGGNERRVNLNEITLTAIKNYLKCAKERKLEDNLFKARTGYRLTRWRIYERVKYYLRRTRIAKKISPHRLRHSFATQMIKAGTNVVVLKELLGHRSLSSTMRYIRVSGEQLREAIAKLNVDNLFEEILAKFPLQKRRYQRAVVDSG